MEYKPFLNMNVLVSDALLASVPAFTEILVVLLVMFIAFWLLHKWLNSDI